MLDTITSTIAHLAGLTVDQLGRPLDDRESIRRGIPAWHPRNDGEGGGDGGGGDGGAGGDGGGDGGGNGGGSGGGDGGGGDENVTLSKADHDNLQRQLRESRERLDKIEKDRVDAERKRKEDEGKFQELAETEKTRADAAEARATKLEQTQRVERIAGRLKFKDPADVLHHLSDDVLGDDAKVEKSLKDIAKSKPYLIEDGEKPKTRDLGGGDGGGDGDAPAGIGTARLARHYAGSSSKP